MIDDAWAQLAPTLPESHTKAMIHAFAWFIVYRNNEHDSPWVDHPDHNPWFVAEEPPPVGDDTPPTFTVVHNPTGTPFRPPPGRRLRTHGAWSSQGHPTVPAAVAALAHYQANHPQ